MARNQSSYHFKKQYLTFLFHLALDDTAKCICEIHYLALDGFDLNNVHKVSSREKKSSGEPGFERRAARMLPLFYAALIQYLA